jgi:hypothetical protein
MTLVPRGHATPELLNFLFFMPAKVYMRLLCQAFASQRTIFPQIQARGSRMEHESLSPASNPGPGVLASPHQSWPCDLIISLRTTYPQR